jgi:hypothetical protein
MTELSIAPVERQSHHFFNRWRDQKHQPDRKLQMR